MKKKWNQPTLEVFDVARRSGERTAYARTATAKERTTAALKLRMAPNQ